VPMKKFKISEIKIGGEPIRFAGQIAEHVFIQVTVIVGPKKEFTHSPKVPCGGMEPLHAIAATIKDSLKALPGRSRQ